MSGHALLLHPQKAAMSLQNRLGLYGSYFFVMSGIGFCLPFLPLYLREEKGLSNEAIAWFWVFSALAGLVQFPIGIWSDRIGSRKPFLVVLASLLALASFLLPRVQAGGIGWLFLCFTVVLFAENGPCRATVESLAGAEAVSLAAEGQVGLALGMLRFWRPVSIVLFALVGGIIADQHGVACLLVPVAILQALAVPAIFLIREPGAAARRHCEPEVVAAPSSGLRLKDPVLWTFIAAMILFHFSNAPPGAFLGLFLREDLGAPPRQLSFAFVISMVVWLLAVRPAGWLADWIGRKPLLMAGWAAMTIRLVLLSVAQEGWQVLLIQLLDGLAQSLFAIAAAAWVTDRLADPRRAGEAQVLVGSSLVLGSALGPALAGQIVGSLGYRGMFGVLAGVGVVATVLVVFFIPETNPRRSRSAEA